MVKLAEKDRIGVQIRKDLEEDYMGTRKVLYSMAKNSEIRKTNLLR